MMHDKMSLVSEMLNPAREKSVESPCISMMREMTATVGEAGDVEDERDRSGMYSYFLECILMS